MSQRIDDGGSAFPHSSQPLDAQGNPMCDERSEWGMSLRDWFAGQALAGLLADGKNTGRFADIASDAYDFADEMLAQRRLTKPE